MPLPLYYGGSSRLKQELSNGMLDFWDQILTFTEEITTQVGSQLQKDFGRVQATEKGDGSLVTQADRWADQTLREAIADRFPDHGILSEEAEYTFPERDWCWIIDPLDGTTNFTQGVPVWGVSLGLLHQGIPVFGWVHLPPLNQTFHGFWQAPGHPDGAFLNGEGIRGSAAQPEANQFFSLCSRSVSLMTQPFPCKIRMLGAASYNFLMVAAGITLGGVEATPKIWDIAPVWPIAKAAGCAWVALEPTPIFPLQVGHNYRDRAFPTLVVAQAALIPVFQPLVEPLSQA